MHFPDFLLLLEFPDLRDLRDFTNCAVLFPGREKSKREEEEEEEKEEFHQRS